MKRARAEAKAKVHPRTFALRPLSPALGAEIVGVDLSEEIEDHIFEQIRDAWHRNLVARCMHEPISTQTSGA
jgi:hypothetical protein